MTKRKKTKRQDGQDERVRHARTAKRPWGRWIMVLLVFTATLLLIGGFSQSWKFIRRHRVNLAAVPTIESEGVDSAVLQAIDQARQQVKVSPRLPATWGELGMILHAHKFHQPASICYEQAAKLAPTDFRWPYYRAKTVAQLDPQQADTHLKTAVALCDDTPPEPRLMRIEILLELSQLDEAERELKTFLDRNDNNPRARMAEARLLFMRGKYKTSLARLQALDQHLTNRGEFRGKRQSLHLLMAEALRRLGQIETAERMREKAMTQSDLRWSDPLLEDVNNRQTGLKADLVDADLLFGKGELQASINLLQSTVKKYPDSPWGKILLARALIRTGAPDSPLARSAKQQRLLEAEEQLTLALAQDPNAVEAKFRLAIIKTYQGDAQAATDLYRQAIQLKPDFTMAHYNLASCLNRQNDPRGAIVALRASVESRPDFADGHYMLGRLLINDKKLPEAVRHLEIAAQLNPKDPNLTKLYLETRQLSEMLND
ncbi:MAG: tetratricopeptide repeat protein [Pirellulaceae bacterium]|nr:tetratricopeptide repeat protein [Pirellulaceae bacterium]